MSDEVKAINSILGNKGFARQNAHFYANKGALGRIMFEFRIVLPSAEYITVDSMSVAKQNNARYKENEMNTQPPNSETGGP